MQQDRYTPVGSRWCRASGPHLLRHLHKQIDSRSKQRIVNRKQVLEPCSASFQMLFGPMFKRMMYPANDVSIKLIFSACVRVDTSTTQSLACMFMLDV